MMHVGGILLELSLGHASCVIKYSEKFGDYTAAGFQATKPSGTIYGPALSLLPCFAPDEMQNS